MAKQKNSRTPISTSIQSWPTSLASLALGIALISISCKESKKLSLEKQLQPNASGIVAVDSFNISVETVRIDKPSTKNKPHLIIGSYKDPVFGKIYAEAYTHLRFYAFDTLRFGSTPQDQDYVIDSVNYSLYPDFALGNNTTARLKIKVYNLTQPIASDKDYDYSAQADYDQSTSLVDFDFPFAAKTVQSVTLKDSTPQFLASKALFQGCNNLSQLDFIQKFKGLAFVPDTASTYAFGIRAGSTSGLGVTVYYHLKSDPTVPIYKVLGIYDNSSLTTARFTHVVNTLQPSPLDKLGDAVGGVLPSSQTNNIGYLNDMLGIRTRISFPGFGSFLEEIKGKYIITEASILMPNADQTYNQETTRPTPALSMIECNAVGEALLNSSDTLYKYKLIQSEVVNNGKGDLGGVDRDYYTGFQNYNKRFYFPFTLYSQAITNGSKPNNPFIPSLSSYMGTTISQSPLGYTFYDRSQSNGIKLLVILNKLN